MMDKQIDAHDLVSALADGQLEGDALTQAVALVTSQDNARASWHTYHLIGDVLRSHELAVSPTSSSFLLRFQQRQAASQVAFDAVESEASRSAVIQADAAPVVRALDTPAANASVYRWRLVAGVASLAAVATLVMNMAGPDGGSSGQVAQSQSQVPSVIAVQAAPAVLGASAGQMVMIRNAQLDAMLAAHRQSGGASALQMPAGFLRNATHDVPAR
jgi:sigma-E factor negative regulatory protein RseA